LSEVRWPEKGEIVSANYAVFYSGVLKSEKCIAVLLRNYSIKRVTKVKYYSGRLIVVKISATPVDILIVQVYMPTTDRVMTR
jgi:hypothetical protein